MALLYSKPLNSRWMMLFCMTALAFPLVLVQFHAVPSDVSTHHGIPPGDEVVLPFPSKTELPIIRGVTDLEDFVNQQTHDDSNSKIHLDVINSKDAAAAAAILKKNLVDDEASSTTQKSTSGTMMKSEALSLNPLPSISSESHKSHDAKTDSSSLLFGNSSSFIKETVDDFAGRTTTTTNTLDWRNESIAIEKFIRRMRGETITFSEMNSILLKTQPFSNSSRVSRNPLRKKTALLSIIRSQIKNAPPSKTNDPELHPDLFRNISMFKRSYELMERTLKVYIYKEGEKPVFHQPRLRGIYSSEGWFMKLLETSRRYTVKDPRKAHLFYLPFSSERLRETVGRADGASLRRLEEYLKDYVDSVKRRYPFWNRTGGGDHFFVGCHDWAPRITRHHMSNCIQALCNANIARGFTLGKDVSVPVTYIRSGSNPLSDIGGNPPSKRPVLAFFAGGMHGYLRPILLKYWGNNTNSNRPPAPSDMKIFGQMDRSIEGKAVYRDYMKTSKYCICARGYGVHTPRVVESIYYECVPVIISDNYVPPFFEVLDWSGFAVFVLEKDVPRLREILLGISESRYLEMQRRVRMVKRHFLWHKVAEKYDLFHMILHSIWFSRVFRS